MLDLDKDKLRDLPGWELNAPVPICMDGDYRALTFCCKPGYSLTFGSKCKRDGVLNELGLSSKKFIEIKEKFSKENNWDSKIVCFGSITYCCMRRGGCPRRDVALKQRYPKLSRQEFMEVYFRKKKELAKRILSSIDNPNGKENVKPYLKLLE
ncbi:MAG: hypothetical protein P8Y70_02630 [Candidatus Lokiarchaeota archaeon]